MRLTLTTGTQMLGTDMDLPTPPAIGDRLMVADLLMEVVDIEQMIEPDWRNNQMLVHIRQVRDGK